VQRTNLRLQQSESVVVHAASRIYAAYISAGRVPEGDEKKWIERSISEAIRIATETDERIISDDEIQTLG